MLCTSHSQYHIYRGSQHYNHITIESWLVTILDEKHERRRKKTRMWNKCAMILMRKRKKKGIRHKNLNWKKICVNLHGNWLFLLCLHLIVLKICNAERIKKQRQTTATWIERGNKINAFAWLSQANLDNITEIHNFLHLHRWFVCRIK